MREELALTIAHWPPNYLSLLDYMMKEVKKLWEIKVITLLVGVKQQTLPQYVNDTTILVIRDEENLWNVYNLLKLFLSIGGLEIN